jgi:hypothetical protein
MHQKIVKDKEQGIGNRKTVPWSALQPVRSPAVQDFLFSPFVLLTHSG